MIHTPIPPTHPIVHPPTNTYPIVLPSTHPPNPPIPPPPLPNPTNQAAQRAYNLSHPRFLPDPSVTILKKQQQKKGADSSHHDEAHVYGKVSGHDDATLRECLEGRWYAQEEERDYPLIASDLQVLYGRVPKPRATKASALLLQAARVKLQAKKEAEEKKKKAGEAEGGGEELWKMSKWGKVAPKVVVW